MRNTIAFPSTLLALLASAPAQDLKVGDPAPAITIAKWVKGDAVEKFAADKVYVVEFWATWCGPCIASMPHLTKLQAAHGKEGLTVIGVTSQDPNNSLAQVEAMVKDKADGMGYTVAWDDGRKTNDAYMKAAKRNGIPCSFVVDKAGKIAYIGHPMWLDLPLPAVLAGNWDAVKGAEQVSATEKKFADVMRRLATAPDKAEADAEALVKQYPFLAGMVENTEFQGWLKAKDYDKAYKVAGKIVDLAITEKDSTTLNQVAWTIVDPEGSVDKRDLDLALRAAAKGVELTKSKDANVLDTLARVHFLKNDIKKAIEVQTQAVALDGRDDLKKSLAEYQKAVQKTTDAAGSKK